MEEICFLLTWIAMIDWFNSY